MAINTSRKNHSKKIGGAAVRRGTPAPDLLKKITLKTAKSMTRTFTDFYYVDKKHLVALARPDGDEPQCAQFSLLSLDAAGRLQASTAVFIKDGWHADYYRKAKKANPSRGQWVWTADGEENHTYDSSSLEDALNKYLRAHFTRLEKIDNFADYLTAYKRAARLQARRAPGRREQQ